MLRGVAGVGFARRWLGVVVASWLLVACGSDDAAPASDDDAGSVTAGGGAPGADAAAEDARVPAGGSGGGSPGGADAGADASTVDASTAGDAAAPGDAGGAVDAGGVSDAGVDAGGAVDAGVDAGAAVDAGADAGAAVDAGVDAGAVDECVATPCDTDPVATCMDLAVGFACECPVDFGGDGVGAAGCQPRLLGLTTSPTGLTPAFDPEVTSYRLGVPLGAASVAVATPAPAGASVEIDGQGALASGGDNPITLPLGASVHTIEVSYGGASTIYTLTVTRSFATEAYLKASDTRSSLEVGNSVSLDGDRLAVGAASEEAVGGQRGVVYVFERTGAGAWMETARLEASNGEQGDNFGDAVSLDGDVLAVGAVGEDSDGSGPANNDAVSAGAVYVFRHSGTGWNEEAYLKASNADGSDQFGLSVSVSGDLIAVGARYEDGDGSSPDDDSLLNPGAAYVFAYQTGSWVQEAYLKASTPGPSDYFGFSVALDGNYLAVGAYAEDGDNVPPDEDDTVPDAGAVYVFFRAVGVWSLYDYVKPEVVGQLDHFGASVSLSGALLAVGADYEWSDGSSPNDDSAVTAGAAYVFRRGGGGFIQEAYLKAEKPESGDRFGNAICIDGDRVAVGAPYDDSANADPGDGSAMSAGAVYTYVYDGSEWVPESYLKASNADVRDYFGVSVSVRGDRIAVGAREEDGDGSDPADDSAAQAGAAYVFE